MNEHTSQHDHHHPTTEHSHLQQMQRSSTRKRMSPLNDVTNVPIPTHKDGTELSLEERLRYLELKTNAHFNLYVLLSPITVYYVMVSLSICLLCYGSSLLILANAFNSGSHPFFGSKVTEGKCKKHTDLRQLGCIAGVQNYRPEFPSTDGRNCPGLFDHNVCLDHLPEPNTNKLNDCLVYDFGIRAQPEFGQTMAKAFGCEVHAFDPSPISKEWWEGGKNGGLSAELHALENYHFHPYGAGGFDGDLQLNEYDWGQVSIVKYPNFKVDCTNSTGGNCKIIDESYKQKTFKLPVKTLPTIMKELGHEERTIDILKLDVEGSEFQFLENIFDHTGGCPDFIDQITLEWHHMVCFFGV